tara:strand:+ start:526 stop:738 length:213 start_codon:yes stop_codon:yes gene_type:complete
MVYTKRIKKEFNSCDNKVELVEYVANKFQMSPGSVRNNWFSSYWAVPEYKQEKLIDLIQDFKLKNKYKNQ